MNISCYSSVFLTPADGKTVKHISSKMYWGVVRCALTLHELYTHTVHMICMINGMFGSSLKELNS